MGRRSIQVVKAGECREDVSLRGHSLESSLGLNTIIYF